MSNKVYDVPFEKRQIMEANAKRRLELRNQFLKQTSDPFRHATGEGGYVFDPAIQRYQALKVTEFERFKPNVKTVKWGLILFVIPLSLSTYLIWRDKATSEARYRNGEVAYKDRKFKFI